MEALDKKPLLWVDELGFSSRKKEVWVGQLLKAGKSGININVYHQKKAEYMNICVFSCFYNAADC